MVALSYRGREDVLPCLPNISFNRLEISAITASSHSLTSMRTIWGFIRWFMVAIAGSPLRSSSMSHAVSLPVAGSKPEP